MMICPLRPDIDHPPDGEVIWGLNGEGVFF
jgi:hypothetical protein